MLAAAARMRIGRLTVVLPDGIPAVVRRSGVGRAREIQVHDRRRLRACCSAARPGAARRTWTACGRSPDLAGAPPAGRPQPGGARALDRLVARARSAAPHARPSAAAQHAAAEPQRTSRPTTTSGNDFYRLFLDETMTYSSAVFESPDQSLADAQRNKYRRHRRARRPASRACTSSRSAPAGAGSRCTRPASSAAG